MTSPTEPTPDPAPDALPEDPALAAAVLEIEAHVAQDGWDQPARLYALVDTARLVAQEPALAAAMEIDGPGDDGSFTPIEQDGLPPGQVDRGDRHGGVPGPQFPGQPAEFALRAGHQQQVHAPGRQGPGDVGTDAVRGAGDDGGARFHAARSPLLPPTLVRE